MAASPVRERRFEAASREAGARLTAVRADQTGSHGGAEWYGDDALVVRSKNAQRARSRSSRQAVQHAPAVAARASLLRDRRRERRAGRDSHHRPYQELVQPRVIAAAVAVGKHRVAEQARSQSTHDHTTGRERDTTENLAARWSALLHERRRITEVPGCLVFAPSRRRRALESFDRGRTFAEWALHEGQWKRRCGRRRGVAASGHGLCAEHPERQDQTERGTGKQA